MFDVAFGSTLWGHFTQVNLLGENLDLWTNIIIWYDQRKLFKSEIKCHAVTEHQVTRKTKQWHRSWSLNSWVSKSEISERATQQIWRRLWTNVRNPNLCCHHDLVIMLFWIWEKDLAAFLPLLFVHKRRKRLIVCVSVRVAQWTEWWCLFEQRLHRMQ